MTNEEWIAFKKTLAPIGREIKMLKLVKLRMKSFTKEELLEFIEIFSNERTAMLSVNLCLTIAKEQLKELDNSNIDLTKPAG